MNALIENDRVLAAFGRVYLAKLDSKVNRHTLFAKELGMERDEAKILCYKILWQSSFMSAWKNNRRITKG